MVLSKQGAGIVKDLVQFIQDLDAVDPIILATVIVFSRYTN
jgi:hypothetical protein